MKLKKIVPIAFLVILFGCNNSVNHLSDINEDTGIISISFPLTNRGWVNSDVSGAVDSYEFIVYNAETQITTGVLSESAEGYQITVPVGTYDVLAIVGDLIYVYGFGEAQNVVVESGLYTDVYIELNTYTWDITPSSTTVNPNASFTVDVDLILPISSVALNTEQSSYYRLEMNDVETYIPFSVNPDYSNAFTATVDFTAPVTEGDYFLELSYFASNGFLLVDSDYSLNMNLNSIANNSWIIPKYYFTHPDAVNNNMRKTITVANGESSEGLSISLGWGAD